MDYEHLKNFQDWSVKNNSLNENCQVSESISFHIKNGISLCESVYRPGSQAHFMLLKEARQLYDEGKLLLDGIDHKLFSETDIGLFGVFEGKTVALDFVFETEILEAEYKGREVELNRPMRGGKKKYQVYVRDPKTGNIKKISFGDEKGGLKAKVSDPEARKNFAARHRCHLKKDKLTAGYWACRINRYAHLWGGKTYPGYW